MGLIQLPKQKQKQEKNGTPHTLTELQWEDTTANGTRRLRRRDNKIDKTFQIRFASICPLHTGLTRAQHRVTHCSHQWYREACPARPGSVRTWSICPAGFRPHTWRTATGTRAKKSHEKGITPANFRKGLEIMQQCVSKSGIDMDLGKRCRAQVLTSSPSPVKGQHRTYSLGFSDDGVWAVVAVWITAAEGL